MEKVALIAVAKDEDIYIHEWIHHHLYLGFSPIFIGINRTSDKTLEVINKISKTENEVYAYNVDWIDQGCLGINTHIQNLAYSYLSTKINKDQVNYVGYLDIDEFWFNVEGKTVQSFIEANKPFDIASFLWLKQYGENSEFSPPFKDVLYDMDDHVKSILNVSSLDKVHNFSYHVPSFIQTDYSNLVHIDQHGDDISSPNPNRPFNIHYNSQFPNIVNNNISNTILHRMKRSEREYLSLVLRGRPSGELIKSNGRIGFKKAHIKLPTIFSEDYYISLKKFIEIHQLDDLLKERRITKLSYYKDKIESMNSKQLISEISNAQVALNNTIGLKCFVIAFLKKVNDVDTLRDFALSLENIDIKLSFQLMKKAQKLRPFGPLINKKIDEYRHEIMALSDQ